MHIQADIWLYTIGAVAFLTLIKSVKIVPQQEAWIIETFGKFSRFLKPGLNFIIPGIQSVAYRHSLKEEAIDVHRQAAITKDNVTLSIDGVLYIKVLDPVNASYGVSNPHFAVVQLAQTTMRSEIGKMTLDNTFEERERLNTNIVNAINEAATAWGIQCLRYEIKDIDPPANVIQAMELQVAAERKKRAFVLESEGAKEAEINKAEGEKRAIVLASEASQIDKVNRAKGEAAAIQALAEATAKGLDNIAESISQRGGNEAVSYKIAEQYVDAFKSIAKEGTTMLLPANASDVGSMVAQALTTFNKLNTISELHQKGRQVQQAANTDEPKEGAA
jgi:regulator of protease activity HflC (stomatin/prohibitin superfamily)